MLACMFVVGTAAGQEQREEGASKEAPEGDEDEAQKRRRIAVDEYGAVLRRPEGWVEHSAQKGALVTLRAAGDRKAQIEVRASSPIKQTRRESFFNSFHSRLKDAGFVQQEVRSEVEYGGQVGKWTGYEGRSERETFRLVVWQLHREQTAWLFVGFFPAEAGGRYVEGFESLLETLSFE